MKHQGKEVIFSYLQSKGLKDRASADVKPCCIIEANRAMLAYITKELDLRQAQPCKLNGTERQASFLRCTDMDTGIF